MRIFLIATACLAAVLAAGLWVYKSPGWDSYSGLATAVCACLGASIWEQRRQAASGSMRQQVGNGSVAIQSGRDTNIGGRRNDGDA